MAHDLPAAVGFAEQRLRRAVEDDPALDGMGTTMTALLLRDDVVALVHVGDSRAYRWHAGVLEQVTRDHSVVQLLVELGELTPEQAENHPQRHVIVKALRGEGDAVAADVQLVPAVPGDRWLVCSDGVSDVVPEGVLAAALARAPSPAAAVDVLRRRRARRPAARTTSHASWPTSAPACPPANGRHCSSAPPPSSTPTDAGGIDATQPLPQQG